MKKETITCSAAPAAIGPYSVAVRAGNFIFTSGQIGLDPATGTLVAGGVALQTRQALANLVAILRESGCGLEDVVKTTVFLADMASFAEMNQEYAEFFSSPFPARSAFQVAALPKGALVEIEAIAVRQ